MAKRIVRIAPFQAGKVMAVLYAIVSIPFAVIMAIMASFGHGGGGASVLFAIAIPVIYLVVGFVFSIIGAWLYNVVARWTGGLEFVTEERSAA